MRLCLTKGKFPRGGREGTALPEPPPLLLFGANVIVCFHRPNHFFFLLQDSKFANADPPLLPDDLCAKPSDYLPADQIFRLLAGSSLTATNPRVSLLRNKHETAMRAKWTSDGIKDR
jgi:hypothetical protein